MAPDVQARVPMPRREVDVYSLPLTTVEGFVLSRVDGSASLEDISIMSGIAEDEVLGILERLSDLGAVELSWRPARHSGKHGAVSTRSVPGVSRSRQTANAAAPDMHFKSDPARFSTADVEEPAEISVETRVRILHAFHALDGLNLYQTLGLQRDADRAAVRNAYFELSKLFHPDAYFGKELRNFKPKMEAVFRRLTECYDVLGKPKKRREYDEYLAVTAQAQRAQRTLESLDFTDQGTAVIRTATAEVSAPPPQAAAGMPSHSDLRPPRMPQGESAPPTTNPSSLSTAERRARVRERMRQRLRPLSLPVPLPSPAPPAEDGEQRRRSLIDGLRQSLRASAIVSNSPQAQLSGHLAKAKNAERTGDVLLAASHLQLGLGIDPSNPEVLAEYERVSKVVARNLADNYEKQAQYEEKTGNWQAAGRSWMRVSDGRPEDAEPARRAAEAMLKASGDLHRAQRYAQRAVTLEGDKLANLTALARVYLAAGLKLNALRELEKAARLAPDDELVSNLLREAR